MKKQTHGGKRTGAGPPRKMVNPVEVSIRLEAAHLAELKAHYGKKWQEQVRLLIANHLHGT